MDLQIALVHTSFQNWVQMNCDIITNWKKSCGYQNLPMLKIIEKNWNAHLKNAFFMKIPMTGY